MLSHLILPVLVVGSFFDAGCQHGPPTTTICAKSVSSCVPQCALYPSKATCMTKNDMIGCYWCPVNGCQPLNVTITCNYTDSTTCAADASCNWRTQLCEFVEEVECHTQENCHWRGRCATADRCSVLHDENGCIASDGCFWETSTSKTLPRSTANGRCRLCFEDPNKLENQYERFLLRINKTCLPALGKEVITTEITAATTGCSGGSVAPEVAHCYRETWDLPTANGATDHFFFSVIAFVGMLGAASSLL